MSPSPSSEVLRAFGLTLATKTLLSAVTSAVLHPSPTAFVLAALSLGAVIGMGRRSALGPWLLAPVLAQHVAQTLPHTLNHHWFELLAVAVLCAHATARRNPRRSAVRARLVLQLAILSVFFYSGVQKLAHGQFVSGEYLLRAMMLEPDAMGRLLRMLCGLGSMPPLDATRVILTPVELALPPGVITAAAVLSVGMVALEIGLPLLVLAGIRGARGALLVAQIGIGVVSAEYSFAVTATATVLLLWPRPPTRAWVGAFVGWQVVTLWP